MELIISNNAGDIDKFGGQTIYSFGEWSISVKESSVYQHFSYIDEMDTVYFLFGTQYEKDSNEYFLEHIKDDLRKENFEAILEYDGEFICGTVDKSDNSIKLLTDREGVIPMYYRMYLNSTTLTTTQDILFSDYCYDDISFESINDYLRFGCLIGSETMSKRVARTRGGSKYRFDNNKLVETKRLYKFYYTESADENIDDLIDEISSAYRKAIQKRIKGKEKDTCIFMSGGMDSRYLLSQLNQCTSHRIHTYCFGQKHSEEVEIAKKCADVEANPFEAITVNPQDFVENAELYEKMVCGSDMFPQSYIINAVKKIEENCFLTGFALDVYMGGTFLNENAISYGGNPDDFICNNLSLLKMNVFTMEELQDISINRDIFKHDVNSLKEELSEYKNLSIKQIIQAFAIDNRDKNLVLQRELIPAKYKDCSYISCDRDFLKAVSKIPANLRLNHKFYRTLYMKTAYPYAEIVYNNTTLPVLAPVELWKEAARNESNREKLYEKIIDAHNKSSDEKIYYTHYYSDFNGYSRYDESWKNLFEKYLLNENAHVYKFLFNKDKIKALYNEHIMGEKNRRRELIYITSLEIFFSSML